VRGSGQNTAPKPKSMYVLKKWLSALQSVVLHQPHHIFNDFSS